MPELETRARRKKSAAWMVAAAILVSAPGLPCYQAIAGIAIESAGSFHGLFPPVDPALAATFNRFSQGSSSLEGLSIAPIAADLAASHFDDQARQWQALEDAGKTADARALRARIESEVLATCGAASGQVAQRVSSALYGLATIQDQSARQESVLSLEREIRGLERYAAKDAGLSAALKVVRLSAASVRLELAKSLISGSLWTPGSLPRRGAVVNDVTQLNPVVVERVETPKTIEDIAALVKSHSGPISIGGGRFSQGGQTATEGALQIDMRQYDKILDFQPQAKIITVQTGARWRDVQHFVDPHGLAVKIMQTYADFTVGGALSVNAHGRYIGLGPVVFSVQSIKVVLADGSIVTASPTRNPDLFYGAIGGYGGLGVIAEATLALADNVKVERTSQVMPINEYSSWFNESIRANKAVVFHNADMYKPYDKIRAVTWSITDKPLTVKEHFAPADKSYWLNRLVIYLMMDRPWGLLYRKIVDWFTYRGKNPVVMRNHEASYDVRELEPRSRKASTYVLQEYFVPIEKFEEFQAKMAEILARYKVNAMNVSVRHAKQDSGTMLAWAKQEVFAFVLYYKQGLTEADKGVVATWTRELIDAALSAGGSWYLPYQIHATMEQFLKGYPRAPEYFALKARLDPMNKFRNKLLDAYHPETPAPTAPLTALDQASNFRVVYGKTTLKDGFFRFLQNIYHLYSEGKFHQVIAEETAKATTDEEIYNGVQGRLPDIQPVANQLTYGLPSLAKQKKEMARETAAILGPQEHPIDGYVEIGTTGRYVNALKKVLPMKGPTYLLPLWTKSDYSVVNIAERGQLRKVGKDIVNDYDPISAADIPDESVDLVTIYIGLHHAPSRKLDPFVRSLWRILRPGGKLVIRDHDVQNGDMDHFVALAHDVYNDGLHMPWNENKKELRHFFSVAGESAYLAQRGFADSGRRILQAHDPTLNTLMEFTKVGTNFAHLRRAEERRGEDQTFLTLPEWYIVFAARDYAQALKGDPSSFPYFGEAAQYWRSYRQALALVRGKYPFNPGKQGMLLFIGPGFIVENVLKGLYEKTAGRLFERLGRRTPQDDYSQKVAQDFADFVNVTPYYEFPYPEKIKGLWRLPLLGPNFLRRVERLAFMTAVLAGEYFTALLAKSLLVFAPPEKVNTVARTTAVPADVLAADPAIQVLGTFPDGSQQLSIPRYGPFTDIAPRLAKAGVRFQSIAGNQAVIFMTVLAPAAGLDLPLNGAKIISHSPVPVQAGLHRYAVSVPVPQLSEALNDLQAAGATIEHIFDY